MEKSRSQDMERAMKITGLPAHILQMVGISSALNQFLVSRGLEHVQNCEDVRNASPIDALADAERMLE